jgi:ferredoxin--NADP+ reductase
MYRILKAGNLSGPNYEMIVEAPRVASRCLPGQFIIVKIDEQGERIPLTITDYDREKGTIELVYQPVGLTTSRLKMLKAGDCLMDFVGPLGKPSDLCESEEPEAIEALKKKKIVFVAGGVGAAPIYPQAKWLHEHGIESDVIIGARSKDLVMLEERMKKVANVYVTTDDGSYGRSGMVTKCLEDLIAEGHSYDHCVCIGPTIMMKFLCLTTKKYKLHTIVSMNPVMVDGTGMCGACRLMVGGKVKFACVDGPEFDGHKVDFDLALKRQTLYRTQEGEAFLAWKEGKTHHGGCGECGGEQ